MGFQGTAHNNKKAHELFDTISCHCVKGGYPAQGGGGRLQVQLVQMHTSGTNFSEIARYNKMGQNIGVNQPERCA